MEEGNARVLCGRRGLDGKMQRDMLMLYEGKRSGVALVDPGLGSDEGRAKADDSWQGAIPIVLSFALDPFFVVNILICIGGVFIDINRNIDKLYFLVRLGKE